jgi:reprolysin-like metallo-peptidase family M12B
MSHRTLRRRRVAPALTVLLLFATAAWAAEPASGTLSSHDKTVTWRGTPTLSVPNQAGCLGPSDPICDGFALTVDTRDGGVFAVAIAPAFDTDDYDLYVFYPDGTLAAASATGSGSEAVVIQHSSIHGTGPYAVRVLPFEVGSGSFYDGIARKSRDTPTEGSGLTSCLEGTPDSIGIAGVTDSGQIVDLAVAVLLDGVDQATGAQIMAKAAESYAPLGINLRVSSWRTVAFAGTEGAEQIQQAKNYYRGERPRGSDLVYVLTNKDITDAGDTGLAGLADCIGGVRFKTRAFAVGEATGIDPFAIGPFVLEVDAYPEIAAHELGHLMGAHHHYANCAEGLLTGAVNDLSPCTLMFNFVDFQSLNFSQVNGPIVRGHAVNYASP